MTSEKFLEKIKKAASDNEVMSAPEILIEFADELSQEVSNVLGGKVCEATALVVANILEAYAQAIRDSNKSKFAKMSELIYESSTSKTLVTTTVPMDLVKGDE